MRGGGTYDTLPVRNGLVDEHDGDLVADRVEVFGVGSEEGGVEGLGDVFASAILQLGGGDFLVEGSDDFGGGEGEGLVGFRTAEDLEEVGRDHVGGFSAVNGYEDCRV